MVPEESDVQCPWCEESSTTKEWDTETFAECVSREMKRSYRHLFDEAVWGKGSTHFYKCPKCGNWSRGNQLRLIKADRDGLGGLPIIKLK